MSKNTEKLEREVRETRERLSATLDELRYRAKPQRVLNDAKDGLRHSATGQFLDNLKSDLIANSVPLTLLAAGLGWVMIRPNARNQTANDNPYVAVFHWLSRMAGAASQNASSAGAAIQSGAAGAQDRIGSLSRRTVETATALSQSAQSTAAAVSEAAGSTIEAARRTSQTLRHSASSAARAVSTTARGSVRAVERHPALFAATAVAIGGAAALAFFLGRALRNEIAETGGGNERTAQHSERALVEVEERDVALVPMTPTNAYSPAQSASTDDTQLSREVSANLNGL